MVQREENILLNLKYIPQVSLLVGQKSFFKFTIDIFLKKIVCQKQFCLQDDVCNNCQKLQNNYYFDLNWCKFNKNNIMKKQNVAIVIDILSHQSLENNNPKICIIENIEFSSLEASNVFLKFLENLPDNTFLIFYSENIDKILETIKSRCQIFNLNDYKVENFRTNDLNLEDDDIEIIKELINKFIEFDNKKRFNDNFFLIKDLLKLKEKIIFFFQFLLLITKSKFFNTNTKFIEPINVFFENKILKTEIKEWKNNNQLFLKKLIESIISVINKFSKTKNINLNLLLNNFFITIYEG